MTGKAVRLMSFTSGSCGNGAYIGFEDGPGILIDAGVSVRRVRRELQDRGVDLSSLAAVLITHDHFDHIRHLGSYCKHFALPVWATPKLQRVFATHFFTKDWIGGCQREFPADGWAEVAPGISVHAFPVPHDATDTVGFAIRIGEERLVWMTDLGEVTAEAMSLAREATAVVIESNYDPHMLMHGNYTWQLKMRIGTGGQGHLSNDACAEAIRAFWHPGLRNVFLCHLSGNTTTPSMAMSCASAALRIAVGPEAPTRLLYFPRQLPTPLYSL